MALWAQRYERERSGAKKFSVSEGRKDDLHREIMNGFGTLSATAQDFDYKSNQRPWKARKRKRFEESRDMIQRDVAGSVTSMAIAVCTRKEPGANIWTFGRVTPGQR
jgi:hypothetical protein